MQNYNSSPQASRALITAKDHFRNGENGKAYAHFLLALTLNPLLKAETEIEVLFVDCLQSWSTELVSLGRSHDAAWCFEQACDAWPTSGNILHATGQFLFKSGYQEEGISFLQKALKVNSYPDWLWEFQNAASSLVERWHFRMLNDAVRNQGYYDVLTRAIKKGHQKILDIGSGTGLLSMLAVKAGAKKVTACEMNSTMCDLSGIIIEQNKMKDNINIKNVKSTDMDRPCDQNRFTLVVTETADAGLLGEGIIPTLENSWQRLLQRNERDADRGSPMCQVIPAGASVFIQLIQCDFIRKQHRLQCQCTSSVLNDMQITSKSNQITFDPASSIDDESEPYSSEDLSQVPGGFSPLTEPILVYQFNFCKPEILQKDHMAEKTISLPVTNSGRADAIVSWFHLHLDEETTLSSSPDSGSCWEQAVYPIFKNDYKEGNFGLEVSQGGKVDIACKCYPTWMSFEIKCIRTNQHDINNLISSSLSKTANKQPAPIVDGDGSRSGSDVKKVIKLPSKYITTLNDEKYLGFLERALNHLEDESPNGNEAHDLQELKSGKASVLDITGIGLSWILVNSSKYLKNHIIGISSVEDGEILVNKLFKRKDLKLKNFIKLKLDECAGEAMEEVTVIITDLVEMCGVLKENALDDLYLACIRSSLGVTQIIPEVLRIQAVCVESTELIRNTRISGTEATLGIDVGLMNEYKTSTQLYVCLANLFHTQLTEHFTAFDISLINLASRENPMEGFTQETEVVLEVHRSGRMAAVVYWFDLVSGEEVLSTLEEETHWLQAAFMLEEEVLAIKGDKILLRVYFRQNMLSFSASVL